MNRILFSTEITLAEWHAKALSRAGRPACSLALVAALALIAFAFQAFPLEARAANAEEPHLPYVTIDHPQFIPASKATFLRPNDLLIGVSDGKTAKAYPAAILAQHGVVQDQMPNGPIAVTW